MGIMMVRRKKRRGDRKRGKKGRGRWSGHEKIFFVLMIIVLLLGSLNIAKARGLLIPEQPQIQISENTIDIGTLTLEQKIAQMVIVHGGMHNLQPWQDMQLGGIHLFAMENGELFKDTINKFQEGMQIPFFVTVDLEGCWSPFSNFRQFTPVSEVSDIGEAFKKGSEEGKFLRELGFTVNYAPVVDLDDQIWKCRSFPGDEKQITELAEAYILGLQNQNIIATAKHYPGKTLVVNDPHKGLVAVDIDKVDSYPYDYLAEKDDVKAVMVTHVISGGEVNSEGKPAVASEKAVGLLKEKYGGLIITDDTMMLGLRNFFPSVDDLYIAVFKAGNDLIINFDEDPNEIYRMIQVVKQAVERGEIAGGEIDNSVRKILSAKGFDVV